LCHSVRRRFTNLTVAMEYNQFLLKICIFFLKEPMKQHLTQSCPICHLPARYRLVDLQRRKYFKCRKCKTFIISIGAENRMRWGLTHVWKNEISLKSSSLDTDKLLFIYTVEGGNEVTISNAIKAEIHPKTKRKF